MSPFVADRGVALLRPDYDVVNSRYLHACIKSSFLQNQMQSGVHSTALAHLYLNKINSLQVIVPPLDIQESFTLFDEQLDKSKVALQKSIENLDTVIKNLLNKTFTEEIE